MRLLGQEGALPKEGSKTKKATSQRERNMITHFRDPLCVQKGGVRKKKPG